MFLIKILWGVPDDKLLQTISFWAAFGKQTINIAGLQKNSGAEIEKRKAAVLYSAGKGNTTPIWAAGERTLPMLSYKI